MTGNQSNRTWQTDLVARYPNLFNVEIDGQTLAPGYPMVGDGWRDLVQRASSASRPPCPERRRPHSRSSRSRKSTPP
jgi:hypothetical protein